MFHIWIYLKFFEPCFEDFKNCLGVKINQTKILLKFNQKSNRGAKVDY